MKKFLNILGSAIAFVLGATLITNGFKTLIDLSLSFFRDKFWNWVSGVTGIIMGLLIVVVAAAGIVFGILSKDKPMFKLIASILTTIAGALGILHVFLVFLPEFIAQMIAYDNMQVGFAAVFFGILLLFAKVVVAPLIYAPTLGLGIFSLVGCLNKGTKPEKKEEAPIEVPTEEAPHEEETPVEETPVEEAPIEDVVVDVPNEEQN